MAHWLFKTEPSEFSLTDLLAAPKQTTRWDGIRNYQARNYLRDRVRIGDSVFLYHSSCAEPGIVGLMEVVRAGYPDPSCLDPESPYYDSRCTPDHIRWHAVDVHLVARLNPPLPLWKIREEQALQGFQLLRRGNRLSIIPVTPEEWQHLIKRVTLVPL
ncbi:MAG: EVE domain-containing protein [Gammaproteobacteria bacterium]